MENVIKINIKIFMNIYIFIRKMNNEINFIINEIKIKNWKMCNIKFKKK